MQRIAIMLVLAMAQLVACGDEGSGPEPLVCDSTSCSGCCQGNFCIEVPTDSACGANGQACFSCSVGTSCQSGKCEFPTGVCQQSCTSGCCENGLCQSGTDSTACGSGGQICVDCTQLMQSCDPNSRSCTASTNPLCNADNCPGCCNGNVCQDGDLQTSCGNSGVACQACRSDELCQDRQCIVPERLFDVVLGRVVIDLPWAMCVETECDPWVKVTYLGQDYESSRKAGNAVVFDELMIPSASAEDLMASGFKVDLNEQDPTGFSTLCDAVVRVNDWDLQSGEVVVDCTDYVADYISVADITFKFVPSQN